MQIYYVASELFLFFLTKEKSTFVNNI